MARKSAADIHEEQVDQACTYLVDWVRKIDPMYGANIDAAKETYNWTDRQFAGACLAYVLENDLHMTIPQNPAFEPGAQVAVQAGSATCEVCHAAFVAVYRGQRFCGNACAVKKNGLPWDLTPPIAMETATCTRCGTVFDFQRPAGVEADWTPPFCSKACMEAPPPTVEEQASLALPLPEPEPQRAHWDEV